MRPLTSAAVAALAMAVASTAGADAAYRQLLDSYNQIHVDEVVWGNEADIEQQVGRFDPPYFTPAPGKVEVIELVSHRVSIWQRSRRLTLAWAASLPPEVTVRYVALGVGSDRSLRRAREWEMEQELHCAARHMGLEKEVHATLAGFPYNEKLTTRKGRTRFARMLRVTPEALAAARAHPDVAACIATWLDLDWQHRQAVQEVAEPGKRLYRAPSFIINGRYAVDGSVVKDPAKVYRMANRLIRLELQRIEAEGAAHDGPTNDAALAAWLEPRSGEVFSRMRFGKRIKFKGVYSADRHEIWALRPDGSFKDTATLRGEGDASYWHYVDRKKQVQHLRLWRRGRQYVSYAGEDGRPVRYGAFLLTDWLSAPETLWVGLPFKGREAAMAFTPDGKVEARNDTGSLFGTWWLEAGHLNVSFGALGIQSWPWQEAAKHVGFDIPERSLTPWRFERDEGTEKKREREKTRRDRSTTGDGK